MPITLICPHCNATYYLPDNLAGTTVTCEKCNALLEVPDPTPELQHVARQPVGNARYQRIVGQPMPVGLELLGLDANWGEEMTRRDVARLLWSSRHMVLLVGAIVALFACDASAERAAGAAPLFFWLGLVWFFAAWAQLSRISRNLALSIAGSRRRKGFLAHFLSSLLVLVTDFRAGLPALRSYFLALVLLAGGLILADQGGGLGNILPVQGLSSSLFYQAPNRRSSSPDVESAPDIETAPSATSPATAPSPEDQPLPPPPE